MDIFQILLQENMKKWRSKLHISQIKLAELTDLSQSFIAEIERGNKFPSSETLTRIANALKVRPYQLFLDNTDVKALKSYDLFAQAIKELKMKIDNAFQSISEKL